MGPAVNYARRLGELAERVFVVAEAIEKLTGHRNPLRRLPWDLIDDLHAPRSSDIHVRGYYDFLSLFGENCGPAVGALLNALRTTVGNFLVEAEALLQALPDVKASS